MGERNPEKSLIMEVKLSPKERKLAEQKTTKLPTVTIKFSLNEMNKSPLKPAFYVEEQDRRIQIENGLSPGMIWV